MACPLTKLRNKSRTLLAQLEENSCKLNKELKKLYLQTPLKSRERPLRISEYWQLRNDSSGVGGALSQDYNPFKSRVSTSLPNMTMQRRLLLSSKKKEEVKFRKPVKECYCNRQTRKMQLRSNRTKIKPSPCNHCKSLIDLKPMAWVESNDVQPTRLTTPISCETVRRVQRINYFPQSEFLQKKISSTHNLLDEKSQSNSRFSSNRCKSSVCRNNQKENESIAKSHNTSEKTSCPKEIFAHSECLINPKKSSRETLAKRTISSKKTLSTSENVQSQKTKSNHFTSEGRTRSSQSSNKHRSHETLYNEDNFREYDAIPTYLKHPREFTGKTNKGKLINDETRNKMANLYKFREQNYFDTHGSTQTLLSSGSSGSLENFVLNERLFPQPAGKIHRDLVVSMPECVTGKNKRVHYFPRYVVRQEKNEAMNAKKKHTCPLTGHAIDVGTLKIHHPSNSLALRFQKGVP